MGGLHIHRSTLGVLWVFPECSLGVLWVFSGCAPVWWWLAQPAPLGGRVKSEGGREEAGAASVSTVQLSRATAIMPPLQQKLTLIWNSDLPGVTTKGSNVYIGLGRSCLFYKVCETSLEKCALQLKNFTHFFLLLKIKLHLYKKSSIFLLIPLCTLKSQQFVNKCEDAAANFQTLLLFSNFSRLLASFSLVWGNTDLTHCC